MSTESLEQLDLHVDLDDIESQLRSYVRSDEDLARLMINLTHIAIRRLPETDELDKDI